MIRSRLPANKAVFSTNVGVKIIAWPHSYWPNLIFLAERERESERGRGEEWIFTSSLMRAALFCFITDPLLFSPGRSIGIEI